MHRREKDGIHWLEFELFMDNPYIQQATLLRHGGVSEGLFSSLNLGNHLGDHPENVAKNRQLVMKTLELPRMIWCHQCHGTAVTEITINSPSLIPECDAMITNTPNICLSIQHADCQGVIMYDPVHHAAAAVHAGWRGNVHSIFEKVIDKMHQCYRSEPQELLVGISPSLGPNASQFINYRTELPEVFWPFQFKPFYFDLWAISHMQLISCGVVPEHIEIARQCTYSNPEDFFSFRYNKVRGGNGTCVMLKEIL